MIFSDYITALYTTIGGGESTSAFTKAMFESIIEDSTGNLLEGYKKSTWSSYYYGYTGISRLSRKIVGYICRDNFKSVLEEYLPQDEIVDTLVKNFRPLISEIDNFNYLEKLADAFADIIICAAKSQKSNNKSKGTLPTIDNLQPLTANDHKSSSENLSYDELENAWSTSEYYNLIIGWFENCEKPLSSYSSGHIIAYMSRFLEKRFTSSEVRAKYLPLNEATIRNLTSIPCIFSYEAVLPRGTESAAFFGQITRIIPQDDELIRVYYRTFNSFPSSFLYDREEFGITPLPDYDDMIPGKEYHYDELFRSHWTVKHVPLLEVLEEKGLEIVYSER